MSYVPGTVSHMAELIDLAARFGPVEVSIDAVCDVCGGPVESVLVVDDGTPHDVVCGECGLPVVA